MRTVSDALAVALAALETRIAAIEAERSASRREVVTACLDETGRQVVLIFDDATVAFWPLRDDRRSADLRDIAPEGRA
jgi:hypothetical protein